MAEERGVTFMFTDIEGSTRLWEADAEAMSRALSRHDELVRAAIEGEGGTVFKTVGDSFCAAFDEVAMAVRAAVVIQRRLAAEDWPARANIKVRIGLHSGVCERRGGDYFGPTVNRVARLHAVAHGGQIVVSGHTAELLEGCIPDRVALLDLGEHRLKDLQQPERVLQVCADGLEAGFPALRSLGNPLLRHNLPEQVSSFIGRESQLSEVRDLLGRGRLVTLAGAGGVGKTRLALQAAAELLDGAGDGVWFVDLAPLTDEVLVAETVASVLAVPGAAGRPVLETLVDALAERVLLLILDNCEHVIDSAAGVASQLLERCPGVSVLATSREPLRIAGEQVYRVPSLSLPEDGLDVDLLARAEAVRLFVERATQRHPSFRLDEDTAGAVASICRRLDGIPLAIELAAARVGSVGVVELERRLDQRFRLLRDGDRGVLPRHRTLHALIEWSYEQLSDAEQNFLNRLSVFAGGFRLSAAEAVGVSAHLADEDPLDMLTSLVEKSLVHAEDPRAEVRYRLLESVREFGALKLRGDDDAELVETRTAHRDHFLAFAETAAPLLRGSQQVIWRGRLEADYDNLRAALAYCLEDPNPEPGLRLAAAMVWQWRLTGSFAEGLAAVVEQLDRPEAQEPTRARAEALAGAAYLGRLVDPSGSGARAREAIEIARLHCDDRLAGRALLSLGKAQVAGGQASQGFALIAEALALARELGDPWLTASCLIDQMHPRAPADVDAREQEAFRLCETIGDRRLTVAMLGSMGYGKLLIGDTRSARNHIESALAAAQELDFPRELAECLVNLGLAAHLDGDAAAAMPCFVDAARKARLLADRGLTAYALLGTALASEVIGRGEAACSLHGASDSLFAQAGFELDPLESRLRDDSRLRLRHAVGDDRFENMYRAGRALSITDAITLAASIELRERDDSSQAAPTTSVL